MPRKSELTPTMRKVISTMWPNGDTLSEIARNIEKPPSTAKRYIEQMIEEGEIEERDENNGADTEQQIMTETEKKHIRKVSDELSNLTRDREINLRKIATILDKHGSVFESVEDMGMPIIDFLDVAIEKTYNQLRGLFMKKLAEREEKAVKEELLKRIREGNNNDRTEWEGNESRQVIGNT